MQKWRVFLLLGCAAWAAARVALPDGNTPPLRPQASRRRANPPRDPSPEELEEPPEPEEQPAEIDGDTPPIEQPPTPRRRAKNPPRDPSLEELEEHVVHLREAFGHFVGRVRRVFRANRNVLCVVGGGLGLVFGGNVAFTLLFVQSFGATGWPLVRDGLQRGQAAYQEAKAMQPRETTEYASRVAPLRRELVDLAAELAAHRRNGGSQEAQNQVLRRMRQVRRELEVAPQSRRAAPVLVAAFEPEVLRDVTLGIWSGVTVALAAACSSAARTVGIGVSLGEVVSRVAFALLAKLEPIMRRALSALPAEAVGLGRLGRRPRPLAPSRLPTIPTTGVKTPRPPPFAR